MRLCVCPLLVIVIVASLSTHEAAAQAKAKKAKSKAAAAKEELNPFDRPEGSIVDQTARYYVWYDDRGWNLRTTAKGLRNFHGTVRVTDAKIKSCVPVGLKEGKMKGVVDAFQFNSDRSELKFAFKTGPKSDGFNLALDGEEGEIEFELLIDGQKNARTVFVGKEQQHPSATPFKLPAKPVRPGK